MENVTNVKMTVIEAVNEINDIVECYTHISGTEKTELNDDILARTTNLLRKYEMLLTGLLNNMTVYNFNFNMPVNQNNENV